MTMVFSCQVAVKVWQGNYELFKKKVRMQLRKKAQTSVLISFNFIFGTDSLYAACRISGAIGYWQKVVSIWDRISLL